MSTVRCIVLIGIWALVLVPAACAAGMVAHGCAEDAEPSCGHENVCDTDPCNTTVLPARETDEVFPTGFAAAVAVLPEVPHQGDPLAGRVLTAPPLRLAALPRTPAVLPLLC